MPEREITESSDSDKEGGTNGFDKEGGICSNGVTLDGILQYIKEQATDKEVEQLLKVIIDNNDKVLFKTLLGENKIVDFFEKALRQKGYVRLPKFSKRKKG